MGSTATILHADLDAFYASVEQLLDPRLRGKPIAVGGGVVLAASYEARAFGVRSGMPGRRARQLCPDLVFVGGHFDEYQRLGDAAIGVLSDFTPSIEANPAVLRPLFAGDGWVPFEKLVQSYAFADAQAQLEHALRSLAST